MIEPKIKGKYASFSDLNSKLEDEFETITNFFSDEP